MNVEDRRGRRGLVAGGGVVGLILAAAIALLTGDPTAVMNVGQGPSAPRGAEEDELAEFVSVVLADTEDTWRALFPTEFGQRYREPRLVLFTDRVQSRCGMAGAAVGPFYCPADQQVYIDLGFYRQLRDRFRAPGDFAQAYVIAHEVGHHIQTLLGISERTHAARGRLSKREANALSVRQELQADCFAGVWAHHADRVRNIVEPGDLEEALGAAAAIGDDALQRQSQGTVVPESFTHGTSEQRVRWFRKGFDSGDPSFCDTFDVAGL